MLCTFTMKYKLSLIFFIFVSTNVYAINGCRNGNFIYTTYLGTTNFYGTVYPVWSNSNPIVVYNNQDGKNTVPCGQTAPTGITETGGQCWISASLPPTNNSSGVTWGQNATVSSSYVPCPLDDELYILFGLTIIVSCFFFKKSALLVGN